MLEVQVLRPHPRLPETVEVGPSNLCFSKPPRDSLKYSSLRTTGLSALIFRLQFASEPPGELISDNLVKQNWIGVWVTVFLASSLRDSDIHPRLRIIDLRNSSYQLADYPGEGADRGYGNVSQSSKFHLHLNLWGACQKSRI